MTTDEFMKEGQYWGNLQNTELLTKTKIGRICNVFSKNTTGHFDKI